MSAYSQKSRNITRTYILIFLFVTLVSAIFYLIGIVQNNLFWPILGLIVSVGQSLIAYFFGDKIALATNGAKKTTYEEAPKIFETVQNLSKIAGIPTPKIYISPDPSANAFACGRDPKNASICINQGLLNLLNQNELEGVIAHEISQIKNRDILVMTIIMVLASVVSFITDIGFRIMFFGGNNRDDNNKNPAVLIIYFVTILLAPLLAILIQMSVSREREFLADATAVTLTRYPDGLINALQKLYNNPTPTQHYSTSMNHFFIAPPKRNFGEKVAGLFSTHPPINERILALKKM